MRIANKRSSFERYAQLYPADDSAIEALVPAVTRRGHLVFSDLEQVCRWKSSRALPLIRSNSHQEVAEVSAWALRTPSERLQVEALLLLRGVSWPMASGVLHFFHRDPYPVLDVRAVWTLGLKAPVPYTYPFWRSYVAATRVLAERLNLSMRVIDKALWGYSKEHEGPKTAA